MADIAVALYAEFRLHYQQRTKPWEALASWEQQGWRQFIAAAVPVLLDGALYLTPSADLPACRDEDPAWSASLAACYPDPPDYPHPEDDDYIPPDLNWWSDAQL